MEKLRKYLLIAAGGSGQRMQSATPKQFLELDGRPLIMHTLDAFLHYCNDICITIVLPPEYRQLWEQLCIKCGFTVPHSVVDGGATRFASVRNGLEAIWESRPDSDTIVFIHDAARPFVSAATIERCARLAAKTGSAIPVITVAESLRMLSDGGSRHVDRSMFRIVQTPQTFRLSLIHAAYRQPEISLFTDDASVLETAGYKISLTEGNSENIKITQPTDLLVASLLLKDKKQWEKIS
ncbi:MAG: 2-C-methyl-D-erythritol 4-phosphate cytidylyltransferase [Bacteroidales bacterium]|nr:2-C-methyl-D-erythritol 4-phosphate cytidylyltransferase [Bacteroidales bacterium]